MSKKEIKESHESYGLLHFSRSSSSHGRNLFGSSLKHQNIIFMKVSKAINNRHLNNNWYHDTETIIEIEMSPSQFSDAITSMNIGSGVPVTLKYVNKKVMEDCPQISNREQFQNEFKDHINEISEKLKELVETSTNLLTKKSMLKIKEKKELLSIIKRIQMEIIENTPFIQKQFNRSLDKTVIEAKREIENSIHNMVTNLGIESLKNKLNLIDLDEQEVLKIEDNKDEIKKI